MVATILVVRMLVDARLRRCTRYEVDERGLTVFRFEKPVTTIPLRHLTRLAPYYRDGSGMGSAELPRRDGGAQLPTFNGWTSFVPSLSATRSIQLVPSIDEVCATIRQLAASESRLGKTSP